MRNIKRWLGLVASHLSEQTYEESLASSRLFLEIEETYSQPTPDLIFNAIWEFRAWGPPPDTFVNQIAPLILRFVNDVEPDSVLASHRVGLRNRLCARLLEEFFDVNLDSSKARENFYMDVNLIAHCANLGYICEAAIRNHILQSLSYKTLDPHQAKALCILFKIAGATFDAYVDPSLVDRCFELLQSHSWNHRNEVQQMQEVFQMRKSGWKGLPPPPVFAAGKPEPTGTNQKDPSATPVATCLGLSNVDPEPPIPQSLLPESITAIEIETTFASPAPAVQSPSISIATLSDFTIADCSDDESLTDPTAITPHGTFYLEDGNVEVLCENTLFRVHTSILSFRSPTLRQMFAPAGLTTAESPNGCPRVLSSDTAADFVTLLKMIYLDSFSERNQVPDFKTFSSLLRITTKYEMPVVRSQVLEVIRDAYPETFEGVTPTKVLGEKVFTGPTPHPNEVLNLLVQQKVTSALPMAYYMAARRGVNSLMDRRLSKSTTLSPEICQSAIKGCFALRALELNETHRLILGSNPPFPCSSANCPSRRTTGPRASDAHRKVIDRITDPAQSGTKVLQVLSLSDVCGGGSDGFCESCVRGWEAGHADVRKRAWDMLPEAFGLDS